MTFYVATDRGSDVGDGRTPATAVRSARRLLDVITAAYQAGDVGPHAVRMLDPADPSDPMPWRELVEVGVEAFLRHVPED